MAFVANRFDRSADGAAVHIEDFAQVLDRYPEQKYPSPRSSEDAADFAVVGEVIAAVCPQDLREYLRRLVFMVLSGNADLHLKNWSLRYPDGRRARLAPAYDLIANVGVPDRDIDYTNCALRWCGREEPRLSEIGLSDFADLTRNWDLTWSELRGWIREDVERISDAWHELAGSLPLEHDQAMAVSIHLQLSVLGRGR
jgi:serine/threonine-protein kinase HipA